jgi:tetratricopeptide (TPR) repeat protein
MSNEMSRDVINPLANAAEAESSDPALHRAAIVARRASGDELGAMAHQVAAETLEAFARFAPHRNAMPICNVATGYFMKGEYTVAAGWYQLALTLDPGIAVAYQNLAAIYAQSGRSGLARACRERAYQLQRVFIEEAGLPRRRVLILCAGHTAANVPFDLLLPTPVNSRVKYVIDYAAEQEDSLLPAYDLVFNAVGEPDVAAALAGRLARFIAQCKRPVLNTPETVAKTRRNDLASLIAGIDNATAAPCIRCPMPMPARERLTAMLAGAGIAFPVLARPTATHGGTGLTLCSTLDELEIWLCGCSSDCYITAFRDCRGADGRFRKYRVVFVDREPYPYHLAISDTWMVHYFSAGMENMPDKIAEEKHFLEQPRAALGSRAMDAIAAIGRRIDLDYSGIDFALLPDGRILLFEANATMLVHRERSNGPLAHKNARVQAIVDAFERMLARKSLGATG